MLAGRPHEAAGNGSPRWMTAAPRERAHRTRPTGRLTPPYGLDLRRRITRGSGRAHSGHICLRAAENAIDHGERVLTALRKSLPSLLMVGRDLTRVLNDQYPNEPETQTYIDQLHALSSLTDSLGKIICPLGDDGRVGALRPRKQRLDRRIPGAVVRCQQ